MYHKKSVVMFVVLLGITVISLNDLLAIPLSECHILITKRAYRVSKAKAEQPIKIRVQTASKDEKVHKDIVSDVDGTSTKPNTVQFLANNEYKERGEIGLYAEYATPGGSTSKALLIIKNESIKSYPWTEGEGHIFRLIDAEYMVNREQIRVDVIIL